MYSERETRDTIREHIIKMISRLAIPYYQYMIDVVHSN